MPKPIEYFKNSNIPKPVKRGKPRIEKISFGEHEEEIFRVFKGLPPLSLIAKWKQQGLSVEKEQKYYNGGSMLSRMNRIRGIVGYNGSNTVGYCSLCKNFNTHLVKYKTQGITLVERFCTEHVPDKI